MKRNEFLKLSAFATAAVSFPFLESCKSNVDEQGLSHPAFLSRLFDENTIKETGKAYLQKTPKENNKEQLIQLLAKDGVVANTTDEKAIHDYLAAAIQKDFESGNTVTVKGWVLALTEARQCALFSLLNK